jgi:hypothetical protein
MGPQIWKALYLGPSPILKYSRFSFNKIKKLKKDGHAGWQVTSISLP